jgi:hypothetical protein
MENKIDQFFKEKLEEHTLPASEEVWAKVEANLSKKNNIAIWRIAAAVLLMGALVSTIIWLQRDHKNNEQLLATKKSSNDNSTKEKSAPQNSLLEKKAQIKPNNKKSSNTLPSTSPRFVSPQTKSKSVQKGSDEIKTQSVQTQPSVELTATEIIEKNKSSFTKASEDKEKIKMEATPPMTIASTKKKSIKLEFRLDDFSSEQPVATASEEKSSGLKKVWEMAREVKNGNGPVREIKNEIFALNFKKNKNQ